MSAQTQIASLPFEELLKMEEQSEARHEYIGGRLYATAGGTPAHADIGSNLQIENGDWVLRVYLDLAGEMRLEHFEISVPLGEIYEDVEFGEADVLPIEGA